MNKELISIIVPIYNVEKYIKQCIDSILNQTYKNLEIILVDDGSPDNCGNICEEYSLIDKRIKVLHKNNGGLSSARNAGLDIANGEYISFVDSDDILSEKFIETLYMILKKYDSDIAQCNFIKFSDNIIISEEEEEIKTFSSIEIQEYLGLTDDVKVTIVCNKLYKKNIFKGLRFPLGKINEDEFFTYKALDNITKNIVVTNKTLYYYRQTQDSITGKKFSEKRLDIIDALNERKSFYKDKNQKKLYDLTVRYYQIILKKYYILTKIYIEKPELHLERILKLLRNNFKECIDNKQITFCEKIKMLMFVLIPNMYCFWMKLFKINYYKKQVKMDYSIY